MSNIVLIIDDHPLFRSGLKTSLEEFDLVDSLLTAGSLKEATEILETEHVDLAFLDIHLGDGNGIQFLKKIGGSGLNTKFIMLSMYHEATIVKEAMASGASGYLSKDASEDEIRQSVKTVLEGGTYFNAPVTLSLVNPVEENRLETQVNSLTPTEKRILKMIAESKSSKEIADILSINFRTVENHRSNICGKLNISGANSLVKFAFEHKIYILSSDE